MSVIKDYKVDILPAIGVPHANYYLKVPGNKFIHYITDGAGNFKEATVPFAANGAMNFIIDGGSSVITTGLKGYVEWSFNAIITGWTILADQVGSIVVDVWKDSYGNFAPTVADSIAGLEKPTIVTAIKNQDLSLSSFQTIVTSGDIWAINVDSITNIQKVTVAFRFNKT